jgi:hypothetical protein
MRNIPELLNVLLDSMDKYFESGLCSLITDLNYYYHIITIDEAEFLRKYLKKHTPITSFTLMGYSYWWPPRNSNPRKRWLKYRIWIHHLDSWSKNVMKKVNLL